MAGTIKNSNEQVFQLNNYCIHLYFCVYDIHVCFVCMYVAMCVHICVLPYVCPRLMSDNLLGKCFYLVHNHRVL